MNAQNTRGILTLLLGSLLVIGCSSAGRQQAVPLADLSANPDLFDWRPTWSPDGMRIAFSTSRDGNWEIYVMRADGSDPQRLTHHDGFDGYPAWSPDGRQIVFTTDRDGDKELYTMDVDGSNPVRRTHAEGTDQAPAWSPEGTRIAFFSTRDDGDWEIYVMRADGSDPQRLTRARGWDFMPAWSPDGTRIAFDSRRDGRRGIYVMRADGSDQTKVSNTGVSDFVVVARQDGVEEAIRRYRAARAQRPEASFFVEAEVDLLAYAWLDEGRTEDALTLFAFNAEVHPESVEAFLSLGDVHTRLQNKEAAIAAYETALALAPDRAATVEQLQQARAD